MIRPFRAARRQAALFMLFYHKTEYVTTAAQVEIFKTDRYNNAIIRIPCVGGFAHIPAVVSLWDKTAELSVFCAGTKCYK
ncbi:MAG: hypothetical protein VB092_07330 [Oscillospiraceae bacterium]|nr:hypothetical protein [Oscillospiraceae bacterium]